MTAAARVALLAALLAARPAAAGTALDGSTWTFLGQPEVPRLEFQAGRIRGSDGCAPLAGRYDSTTIAFTPPAASARTSCTEAAAAAARDLATRLAGAHSWTQEFGMLDIRDASGDLLLQLRPYAATLANTYWRVVAIADGRGRQRATPRRARTDLHFTDTALAGNDGCNHYSGTWHPTRTGLQVDIGLRTALACMPPLPAEPSSALAEARRLDISGGRLTLRSADGAVTMVLVRASGR